MKNNLVGFVVGLTLAIIILGSVLAPTINVLESENVTEYTNTGTETYFYVDSGEDVSISTGASLSEWTLNGENYPISSAGNVQFLTTDKCRIDRGGAWVSLYDSTGVRVGNLNTLIYHCTFVYDVSEDTFTFTQYSDLTEDTVAATYTYTVTHMLYFNPDGDYVSYTSADGTEAPSGYYVNSLSDIICGGAYTSGDLDTSYFGQGETVTVGVSTYTASATATTAKVLDDVLTVSDYTVTVTDGTTTETFIPYTIYVPKSIEGHTADQALQNQLYGVIVVITVCGVLCAAAFMLYRRD